MSGMGLGCVAEVKAVEAYVFDVAPLWVATATITAALPTGANVFNLAQKYNAYLQRAASTVVLSTDGSIVSVAIPVASFVASVDS